MAYSRPFVRARDREIIARAQDESGLEDEFWFVVRADQYLMTPRTQRFSTPTPTDPIPISPATMLSSPRLASTLATQTLAGMVLGGDPVAKIAEWYELTEDQVQQAVDFTVVHNLAA